MMVVLLPFYSVRWRADLHWSLFVSCSESQLLQGGAVERPGRLNSQQLKDLSDELAALTKQQSDARLLEVFVRMSEAEIKAFDLRTQRISRIHILLSEHDSRR
jgi:hypothetical protein